MAPTDFKLSGPYWRILNYWGEDDTGDKTVTSKRVPIFPPTPRNAESMDETNGPDPKPGRGRPLPSPTDQESARTRESFSQVTPH